MSEEITDFTGSRPKKKNFMRKKRNRQKRRSWIRYVRELSVVIIGVLTTLLITSILSDRARQAEVERALTLVKTELEENLQKIGWAQQKWETEQRVYALIRQNIDRIEAIPLDTLRKYRKVIGDKHSLAVVTDSYEVLKSSLLMQYIKDKDFLSELSKTYGIIGLIGDKLNNYSNIKGNGINHMMSSIDRKSLERWTNGDIYDFYNIPLDDNVFRLFIYTGNSLISAEEFEECKSKIASLIHKIEELGYIDL